jgi:hypothetical protein
MTPEKQRIAIGEAHGWKCNAAFKEAFACWVRPGNAEWQTEWLPDYLSDLNQIHEAEKMLTEAQWGPYCVRLNEIVCACGNTQTCGYTIAATAAQRAEAFLRVLGLWKETKQT